MNIAIEAESKKARKKEVRVILHLVFKVIVDVLSVI